MTLKYVIISWKSFCINNAKQPWKLQSRRKRSCKEGLSAENHLLKQLSYLCGERCTDAISFFFFFTMGGPKDLLLRRQPPHTVLSVPNCSRQFCFVQKLQKKKRTMQLRIMYSLGWYPLFQNYNHHSLKSELQTQTVAVDFVFSHQQSFIISFPSKTMASCFYIMAFLFHLHALWTFDYVFCLLDHLQWLADYLPLNVISFLN